MPKGSNDADREKQKTMKHLQQVITVLENGEPVIGYFFKEHPSHTSHVTYLTNGKYHRVSASTTNSFPLTTEGVRDAFELALELKLQEARENLEDGYEEDCNQAFIDACEKVKK